MNRRLVTCYRDCPAILTSDKQPVAASPLTSYAVVREYFRNGEFHVVLKGVQRAKFTAPSIFFE